jgi:hypothetical protein
MLKFYTTITYKKNVFFKKKKKKEKESCVNIAYDTRVVR